MAETEAERLRRRETELEAEVGRLREALTRQATTAGRPSDDLAFLRDGGEMGALMRAHDWGSTPLGSPGTWPQSLRSVLSACLNSPMLGAVLWGPDLLFLYNDAYAPSLAERHPRALGRPVAEVWGDAWDRVSAPFHDAVATGRGFSHAEVPLPISRHGQLEATWWDFTATPIRGEDGTVVGLLNQGIETTASLRTAAALRTNERHNRQVLDSASDFAIVATDLDGRVTRWNEGARRIIGWSEAEMLGETAHRFFTPEDVAAGRVETEMRDALALGHGNDERWHRRKGGERFWAVGDMTVLRDEEDVAVGFVKILRDRTGQRAVEETRRAEAEILTSVLASSSDCIKVLDLDAKLLFMSEGGRRVMEVADVDAIQGCFWPDFWQGSGHDQAKAAVEEAKAGGVGWFQGPADTMARTPRYWDVRVTPILGVDGRPEKLLSVSRDITAAWEGEKALREAQSLNALILGSSRDCIVVLDLEGRTQFVSPGGIEAMEVSNVDAVIGLSWLRVWGDSDHDAARAAVEAARGGGTGRFEGFCPTHRGTPKWWDVVISPLPGTDGLPERLVSVGRDITNRRQMEQQLRSLNETLEHRVEERTRDRNSLWELSSDLMLRYGFEGLITAVNPAWTVMLGWREDELIGASLFDFIHPDDLEHTIASARELSEGIGHTRFDNRYRHKHGGHRWISWSTRSAEGLINAVGRDFTAEREKTEALKSTEEQLRQSQKMEAVGQLTGGLAHDFNNLLTGISGSLEMLGTRIAQGRYEEVDRYVVAAQGSARRAAALTHRLLAFSRRQTLDPKPTDVNRLVHDMADLIRRTVGPQIHLEAVGGAGLWSALVDPSQLENALLNLAINARDAMPDGGRLTIETGNRWMDERTARERDLAPGQYLSICVSDTGTGMPPEVIARAFDPFFTTKPLGQGTGLGLSMIYGFARQSGGQVRIYSEMGQGSMVCIYLPRHYGEGIDAHQEAVRDGETPRAVEGETVLVVDDEPTVRMLVADVLSDLGYAAIEAEDGPAGLKVLQGGARVDLLVTDVGLPGGMNGRQVADAARALRPGLKVLFITGYAENAVVGNGHLDPGMEILTKPFAIDDLASKIKTLIES